LLGRLREAGLRFAPEVTWDAAGVKLLECYREVIAAHKRERTGSANSNPP
jgi:hypothetical protein